MMVLTLLRVNWGEIPRLVQTLLKRGKKKPSIGTKNGRIVEDRFCFRKEGSTACDGKRE